MLEVGMGEEKFLEVRLVGGIGEKFWECMPQRVRHHCFRRRLRRIHGVQPAAEGAPDLGAKDSVRYCSSP
jgi:hypothetical protein